MFIDNLYNTIAPLEALQFFSEHHCFLKIELKLNYLSFSASIITDILMSCAPYDDREEFFELLHRP